MDGDDGYSGDDAEVIASVSILHVQYVQLFILLDYDDLVYGIFLSSNKKRGKTHWIYLDELLKLPSQILNVVSVVGQLKNQALQNTK